MTDDYTIPCLPLRCYHPEYWHRCGYCYGVPVDDVECTIEATHDDDQNPCGVLSPGGRSPTFSPAAMLTPRPESHDIFYSDFPFRAGGGSRPEGAVAKYFLKSWVGTLSPFPLGSGLDEDQCSVWLCHIVDSEMANRVWNVWCNWPITLPDPSGGPPNPSGPYSCVGEDVHREYSFQATTPGDWRIAIVHISFTRLVAKCFPTLQQWCFTWRDSEFFDNVGTAAHGTIGVIALDSLMIDVNASIADDERYPHAESEFWRIANLALAQVSNVPGGQQINNPGHFDRQTYDSNALSLWLHNEAINEPIQDGANNPLAVDVRAYLTNTLYPADLEMSGVRYTLRITPEPGWEHNADDDQVGLLRMHATIEVWVSLRPRLRPGYQDINGPMTLVVRETDGVPDPTDFWFLPDPNDPDTVRPYITERAGCSQVPLFVKWRGILTETPWSRIDSPWLDEDDPAYTACCRVLFGIDGMVMPGEPWNIYFPTDESRQAYRGDVTIAMNTPPELIAGCAPP